MKIPESILRLVHDCDPDSLSWERHRGFLIDRVLSSSNWQAIGSLRKLLGDNELAARIRVTQGRKLSQRQLRFWQVLLDLDPEEVLAWRRLPGRRVWDRRGAGG